MKFTEWWKAENYGFTKEKLTQDELMKVREKIIELQKKGLPSSKIITALQKMNSKLMERWKSERVYWTESKRDDTKIVAGAGEDIGINTYKVILSPNACKVCIQKTNNGKKIFKTVDIEKSGYGHVPPFHPNCYCVIIPKG